MKRHLRMLDKAIKAATISTCQKKHGVVIAKGNKVLAIACNHKRNDPDITSHPKTESAYHAEVKALKNVEYPQGCTCYSVRVWRDGSVHNAKPCKFCQNALIDAGIKDVWYSTDDGYKYRKIT